jgi:hypothetical protein
VLLRGILKQSGLFSGLIHRSPPVSVGRCWGDDNMPAAQTTGEMPSNEVLTEDR